MKGKKIETIERVIELADQGKAIFWIIANKPVPAAFCQNWQARQLHCVISRGEFFEYVSPKNAGEVNATLWTFMGES